MVDVTQAMVEACQRDGVVLDERLWADRVEELRAAGACNMAAPGSAQMATLQPGEPGQFFKDCCNRTRSARR